MNYDLNRQKFGKGLIKCQHLMNNYKPFTTHYYGLFLWNKMHNYKC